VLLPFDLNEVVDNLRYERYANPSRGRWLEMAWAKDLYYLLRPMFPVGLRKHLQRLYLRGRDAIRFPGWPVDRSVDILCENLLVLALQTLQIDRLPFIWFWPDGHSACAIVTHDVETTAGRDFCERLMDIDDRFGIKASFQIVPERRYEVSTAYLQAIRDRGFEINLHGLDHDGNLFESRETFLKDAEKINKYAELFGSRGFRSPSLYRNIDWFQDLHFSYDMSVPNVARLEPQGGGCCTVMPYFLPGGMTELPLTTAEDYTLFQILNDYSATLWEQQMRVILEGHGLISFIVHPDYVTTTRAQDVYRQLLEVVNELRSQQNIWLTLPREVDTWWRERSEMNLVPAGPNWRIEGTGSNRAKVAYACLAGGQVVYEIEK
jgi:peptidoglycan/xylan/chitin deacetylase (PgdA/CDA1 family)